MIFVFLSASIINKTPKILKKVKYYLLCIVCLISSVAFSQDAVIKTKFTDEGSIHETVNDNSKILGVFKKNEKCTVLEYLGQNFYKIAFNDLVGCVGDEFLMITEDMMDLFYDYEEREFNALIAQEAERQKRIKAIVSTKEQARLDAITKAEVALNVKAEALTKALHEKTQEVAMANEAVKAVEAKENIKVQNTKALEAQRIAKAKAVEEKAAALAKQKAKDAQAKAEAAKQKDRALKEAARQAAISTARNAKAIEAQRIAKAKALEEKAAALAKQKAKEAQIKAEAEAAKQKDIALKKAAVKAAQKAEAARIKLEKKEQAARVKALEKKRNDSIARTNAQQRLKALKQIELQKAKAALEASAAAKAAKALKLQQKQQAKAAKALAKQQKDASAKAKVKRKALLAIQEKAKAVQKRKTDSIAQLEKARQLQEALDREKAKRLLEEKEATIAKAQQKAEEMAQAKAKKEKQLAEEKALAEQQAQELAEKQKAEEAIAKLLASARALEQKSAALLEKKQGGNNSPKSNNKVESPKRSLEVEPETQVAGVERIKEKVVKVAIQQKANVLSPKQDLEAVAKTKARLDSIAQLRAQEKQELARALQVARQQIEALKIQRIKDSLARVKAEEKLLALEVAKQNKLEPQASKNTVVNTKEKVLEKAKTPARKATTPVKGSHASCAYQINEFDRFYNIRTLRTERYAIADNLTVELHRQGIKTSVFFNLSQNLGCASYLPNQRSTVKVTLENNKVIAFYHSWDIECGEFLFKASLSNSKIIHLKASPIKHIVFKGTKGTLKLTDITNKSFFVDMLKCID